MFITDLLWCLLAAILLIGIEYVSYLYIKTNVKRNVLCLVWLFIIFVLYYAMYQIINYVFSFDSISMIVLLLFAISLSLIKIFLPSDLSDDNE